jgi:hypothetical protein
MPPTDLAYGLDPAPDNGRKWMIAELRHLPRSTRQYRTYWRILRHQPQREEWNLRDRVDQPDNQPDLDMGFLTDGD